MACPSSTSTSAIRIRNSSPPWRATTSDERVDIRSRLATSHSSWSPAPCPKLSLTSLKSSRSTYSTATPVPVRSAAGQRQLQVLLEQDPVGQAGQRVVVGEPRQLLLGLAPVGDVLADPGAAGDRAVAVAERRGVPGEQPLLAGAGDDRALAVRDHVALGQLVEEGALDVQPVVGGERLDPRTADQLVVPPAGQLGEVLVDEHDPALEVGRDRGQAHVLEQLAEALLGLQQQRLVLLLRRHLEDHALHEAGDAGRVAHGHRVVAEPADAAVDVDQPVLGGVGLAGGHRVAVAVGREQVVGVDPLHPAVGAARPLLGRHAHQRLQLRADVDRIAGAGDVDVGDGGQVLDQAAVAVLGLALLAVEDGGVHGGADDVGQRAEELEVVLAPHPVAGVDDLEQPDASRRARPAAASAGCGSRPRSSSARSDGSSSGLATLMTTGCCRSITASEVGKSASAYSMSASAISPIT